MSSAILSLKRKRRSRLVEDKGLDFPCLIKDFPTYLAEEKGKDLLIEICLGHFQQQLKLFLTGVDSPQVLETMGSLQLVPQTPTTRKAETDSNQSTTIHERIPSSYRPTRFDVIERSTLSSAYATFRPYWGEPLRWSSRDGINGTLVPRDPSPPTKLKLAFLHSLAMSPLGLTPALWSPKATESPNRRAIYSSPDRGAKQPTSWYP